MNAKNTPKIAFLVLRTGCISDGPAGLSWNFSIFCGKVTCVKTIEVNSGWRGLGLWSQSYQHHVKLTIASGAHGALSFLMIHAHNQNWTVCTLSGCSSPWLTETVFTLKMCSLYDIACLHWVEIMWKAESSLSLFFSFFFFFGGGHETGQTKTKQQKLLMSKQSVRQVFSNGRNYGTQHI